MTSSILVAKGTGKTLPDAFANSKGSYLQYLDLWKNLFPNLKINAVYCNTIYESKKGMFLVRGIYSIGSPCSRIAPSVDMMTLHLLNH